uniref:non-specific serine/threonine protein kinase n=1 Tax=Anopheles coluzzii TaxID=1518534 RepID=A0A8W7P5D7_ANOCL
MAVWGKVKIASTTTTSKAPLARTPSKAGSLFSETLTAALGKRKSKFKDITDELNQHINAEEREELYQRPLFNADKIRRMMERIVEKQFDVDEEEMRYVYNPAKNLKMCQNISKQIKDRMKAMNFKRHRIISIATIVEKQQQGIHYKMKYILDPKLDDYVRLTSTELTVPKIEISFDTPNRDRFLRDDFRNKRESYAVLGRGSYGVVIKASYRGRPVAVKILEKRSHRHRCRYDSLLNEANALNLRHDNIVTVLKIVPGAQYGLVLMERFDGYCLQRIIGHQRNHPIAVQHKLLILCDIISGLCFCHRHNIVHLDVKPQNVIVTVSGAADQPVAPAAGNLPLRKYLCKLCDFGSSMMLQPWQPNETLVNRGTIRYMAPELLRGTGGFTARADIYSFGVTMWQLDEGRFPYEEITCNEVIAYNVVKKGLRPDSITTMAFGRRATNLPAGLRDIGCLHGSLRGPISLTGGGGGGGSSFTGRFETDAVDDVLKRQGIAVEYRAKRPTRVICPTERTDQPMNDQELNVARIMEMFGGNCTIANNERIQLRQTMRTLYSKCWASDPACRPDAPAVRAAIHQALEKIALGKRAGK